MMKLRHWGVLGGAFIGTAIGYVLLSNFEVAIITFFLMMGVWLILEGFSGTFR